mgnify:CR=1 FL=1
MEKMEIKSFTLAQLREEMGRLGEKPFRAAQLYEWMHGKLARGYEEMSNIPAAMKVKCGESYSYTALKTVQVQESAVDGTKKFLFALSDVNLVESVWMRYRHGNSVCISSQVGCRMGCRFCASTLDGLVRNLTPAEMLDQIYAITLETGERVSNVVVMGSGAYRRERPSYQPAKRYGIHLRHCARNAASGAGEIADYAGAFPACGNR